MEHNYWEKFCSILQPPMRYLCTSYGAPAFSCPDRIVSVSPRITHNYVLTVSLFLWSLAALSSVCPHLFCTGKHSSRHWMDPAMCYQGWGAGKDHPPQSAGSTSPHTAQGAIGCLCHKDTLLAQGMLDDHQDTTSFSGKLLFSSWCSACHGAWRYSCPGAELDLLNFMNWVFSHHKSILTPSNHLLITDTFGNSLQADLPHHLPQEQRCCWAVFNSPDPSSVPLEDKSYPCFLWVLRDLPHLPWSFEGNWEWPLVTLSKLTQLLWIYPIGTWTWLVYLNVP